RPHIESSPRQPAYHRVCSSANAIHVASSSGASGPTPRTWTVPVTHPRSEAKPSIQATRPPGEMQGDRSCHSAACTRSTLLVSRSISPIQASYQALSDGSSVQTAATLPPAQPTSKTLIPGGPTSVVAPEPASTR